ncbi:hypothetical protein L484_021663 [Morus notabilis]|uniref:Uncharacterized protein n=1 Tax=Morus notabilis TaxID=981085 RepID=W9SH76_9ROSA|nr:hypothetical protein L484_021663 [Morus notabilis]
MDYALCLRYGNPSTFPQLTSTRPNIMFSSRTLTKYSNDFFLKNNPNPSISLSNLCAVNAKVLGPVVLAHRRFPGPSSTSDDQRKKDREIERIISSKSALGASFALACVLGILCLGSTLMLSPKKAVAAFPTLFGGGSSQQNPMEISPISGKVALRAFMEGIVFLGSHKNMPVPASRFCPPNVAKLKGIIYTILDDKDKATESWEEFINKGFQGGPDPFDET